MKELMQERLKMMEQAVGDARLRLQTLEAQADQTRREIDQLGGATMELRHLLKETEGQLDSPK